MDPQNFAYMFYGFLAAWIVLVAVVVALVSREGDLASAMEGLRNKIQDRERKP